MDEAGSGDGGSSAPVQSELPPDAAGAPVVRLRAVPGLPDRPVPAYATPGAAGLDLPAAESVTLAAGAFAPVRTGYEIELPVGYEGQVRPRSGLAFRHGITVLNSPGTIDADYRGEIVVVLINHGPGAFEVQPGERIAQLVIAPVSMAEVRLVTSLSETPRGRGGFGHTGV